MSLHDFSRIDERLKAVSDPVSFLVNLFAHAPVGFAVWSADGYSLLTNAAFMEIFHSEPPPEYNVLADDLLRQNGMLSLFERAFAGETVAVPTFWYDPRDLEVVQVTEGRRVAVSMTIFPLFDDKGRIEYVAATYKDETELVTLNQELEERIAQRTAQLQASNKELEAFSYSVAHDLRAPLRAVNGFANMLQEDYGEQLDDEARLYLDRIANGGIRMSDLIDALLRLSRTAREVSIEPVDVGAVAQAVADEVAGVSASEHRQVHIDVAIPERTIAQCDAALVRTLMANLLDNAYKFSAPTPQPHIAIGADQSAGETVFFVRDNGVGFDMSHAGSLFVPFRRLHRQDEFSGTGVGLATCDRIVRRHGGRMWADSTPGGGATFYFTLAPAAGH